MAQPIYAHREFCAHAADARSTWLEAVDPATGPERQLALAEALKAYCKRDTKAMIAVTRGLAGKGQLA